MAAGFPAKENYVTGEVLTAANMNDLSGTVNLLSGTRLASGKNAFINGNFGVWQRGTSVSVAASATATYTSDRFALTTQANQASTVSRQSTNDTTNLPTIQYCARVQRNSGQTGTGAMIFGQSLETSNSVRYAGQSVILSFYARKGADYSATSSALSANIYTGTGTDQSRVAASYTGDAQALTTSVTLTTSWQRFTISGSIGATATELAVIFISTMTGTASTNDYYEVTGVQLELGTTASTFQTATGTIQGELAACQRYYYRSTGAADQNRISTLGGNPTSSIFDCNVAVPSTFRSTVSAIDVANIGVYINNNNTVYSGGTWTVLTGIATAPTVRYTHTSGAMTQGHNGFIVQNGATAGYFGLSAEL